jgi:hypothetical protein
MMDAVADSRVIEAIATARAMLKPAVDAGLFNGGSNRLKRFLLKFRVTSLDHDGDSWDETAFRYDDTRAEPVIAKAAAGDVEADVLLSGIAIAQLQGLPPNLAAYVAERLKGRDRAGRGRPRKRIDRDVCIHQAVEAIRKCGFDPTRNAASTPDSACSIVATALQELGVSMSEANVVRIWQDVQHRIPVIGKSG